MSQYFIFKRLILFTALLFISFWVNAQEKPIAGSKIQISGVASEIKTNIKLYLGLEDDVIPLSNLGFPRSNDFILSKTKLALQALGYYQPEIILNRDEQSWLLTVVLGDPVTWRSFDINLTGEGTQFYPLVEMIRKMPFSQGMVTNHGKYSDFKNDLLNAAIKAGFLNAQFETSLLNIDVLNSSADLQWVLNTGNRYHIKSVQLKGSQLSEIFLKRYLRLFSGDVYQQSKVYQSQQSLNRSGYFKQVNIEQDIDHDNHLVDIIVGLEDIEKYELKTSLGFGTDTGGKAGISWLDRRVNDDGHNYLLSLDVSEIENGAAFQYKIPLKKDKSELINGVSYRIKNEDLAESKILSVDSKLFEQRDEYWSTQWALTLASEQISSQAEIESHLIYLIPSWKINYYSVTDPFAAQSGWRWQNEIHLGTKQLSDPDLSFIQVEQKAKYIWAFTSDWRLLLRAQAAFTKIDTETFNSSMPTTYRFFAGGDISVRGYPYQYLSPKDPNDLPLGGKHSLVSSIEVDWQFKQDWRLAIFTDQGNTFNDWSKRDLQKSIGTGIRWITPVGSIRLDAARSLDDPKEWHWHITIGPDL